MLYVRKTSQAGDILANVFLGLEAERAKGLKPPVIAQVEKAKSQKPKIVSHFLTSSKAFARALKSFDGQYIFQKTNSWATARLYALLCVDKATNRANTMKAQGWLAKCLSVCTRTIRRGITALKNLGYLTLIQPKPIKIREGQWITAAAQITIKGSHNSDYSAITVCHVHSNHDLKIRDIYKAHAHQEKTEAAISSEQYIHNFVASKLPKHTKKFSKYLFNMQNSLITMCRRGSVRSLHAYCDMTYKRLVDKLGKWDVEPIRPQYVDYLKRGEKPVDPAWYTPSYWREYKEPPKVEKASCMPDWLKGQIAKLRGN